MTCNQLSLRGSRTLVKLFVAFWTSVILIRGSLWRCLRTIFPIAVSLAPMLHHFNSDYAIAQLFALFCNAFVVQNTVVVTCLAVPNTSTRYSWNVRRTGKEGTLSIRRFVSQVVPTRRWTTTSFLKECYWRKLVLSILVSELHATALSATFLGTLRWNP